MKKITKKQNDIFKAHLKAWKEDTWDNPPIKNRTELLLAISDGKTIEGLWNYMVDEYVSVTSHLMMGCGLKHLSVKAKASLRKGFKEFLTKYSIV